MPRIPLVQPVEPQVARQPRIDAAGVGAMVAAPYRALAQGVAQVGSAAEKLNEIEQRKREIDARHKATGLVTDYALALEDLSSRLEREPDPINHGVRFEEESRRLRETMGAQIADPLVQQAFQVGTEAVFRDRAIHARRRGDALFVDEKNASRNRIVRENLRLATEATTPEAQQRHYDVARQTIIADAAAGLITRTAADKELADLDSGFEEALVLGLGSRDPESAIDVLDTGEGLRYMTTPRRIQLSEHFHRIVERGEKRREQLFKQGSDRQATQDIADIRASRTPSDLADIETRVLARSHRYDKADLKSVLDYIDARRKTREEAAEDDPDKRAELRDLIERREITTLAGMKPYAPFLKTSTFDSLQAHMETLNREARRETESEQDKVLDEARAAGRELLINTTTVTGLLGFDQIAQAVRGPLVHAFRTEASGLRSVREINDLAREYDTRAKEVLLDKVRFEGHRLYPLLGTYRTEEQIAEAHRKGFIKDRTTADNMIHLVRYIGRLEAESGKRATQAIAETTTEAAKKAMKPSLINRLLGVLRGETPATPADKTEIEPLVRQAMKELYPHARPIDILRDEAMTSAVNERVIELLREQAQ